MKVTLEMLGGGGEVGRLAVLARNRGSGVILDFGVSFSNGDGEAPRLPEVASPREFDAIVISHAHLDHSGAAPIYFISGSKPVYATRATRDIMRPMFEDFLNLSGYYLPFEYYEVRKMLDSVEPVEYGDEVEAGSFTLEFLNAGHIPGSLSVVLRDSSTSILFTGDFNTTPTRLVEGADYSPARDVEYLVMEATYPLYDHPRREDVERRFIEAAREVLDAGGIVVVPSFSLSRAQEILCVLAAHNIEYPVYYDGMIRLINRILLRNGRFVRDPKLLRSSIKRARVVRGWSDRKRIRGPAVIVTSSGMLKGGPSVYYVKRLAEDPRNAIFLVSFQAPGTPGRGILEKGLFGEQRLPVRARVEWFDFSSHSGRGGLVDLVRSLRSLQKVIIVHSEEEAAVKFADHLREDVGVEAVPARNGDRITLG